MGTARQTALALVAGLVLSACQSAGSDGPSPIAIDTEHLTVPSEVTGQDPAPQGASTEWTEDRSPTEQSGAEPASSTATGKDPSRDNTTASESAPAITAVLAHGCVAAGDEQTVTVTSTPGFQVTVNAQYADGQMGNVHGGLAFAQTIGEDGTFTHTWRVSPDAPAGQVTVHAGAQSTTEHSEPVTTIATFRITHDC